MRPFRCRRASQPLFKALSKVWYSLEEEAEQLKILHNIMLNLQPFKASQAKLFPADRLDALLKDRQVKTDEQRADESSGTSRSTFGPPPLSEWLLIFVRLFLASRARRSCRDEGAGVAAARDHGPIRRAAAGVQRLLRLHIRDQGWASSPRSSPRRASVSRKESGLEDGNINVYLFSLVLLQGIRTLAF